MKNKKYKKYKHYLKPLSFLGAIALVILLISLGSSNSSSGSKDGKYDAIVYKSPTCGCCVKYVAYLEDAGYKVKTIKENNMSTIKSRYNIPVDMESCHTMVMGDYVIEGHVPLEVVENMLAEQPDIEGIALPDMPAGSPGMPGIKQGEFNIYSLAKGNPLYLNY
jgi:hypothetical protein